jgi:hypothetical protein
VALRQHTLRAAGEAASRDRGEVVVVR